MYYCNINYAFNLKSNLGYTYPLVEQSMQKPRLSKYKFFKNFDSSVLLKVRSHITLRNGENREKVYSKQRRACGVRCVPPDVWVCVSGECTGFPQLTPRHSRE